MHSHGSYYGSSNSSGVVVVLAVFNNIKLFQGEYLQFNQNIQWYIERDIYMSTIRHIVRPKAIFCLSKSIKFVDCGNINQIIYTAVDAFN